MFIGYNFIEAFNIYPLAERSRFFIKVQRDLLEQRESSIMYMYMTMSRWIYMYDVRDYLNHSGCIHYNMKMIAI